MTAPPGSSRAASSAAPLDSSRMRATTRGVLFDFDGTLIDSCPGIIEAVQLLRRDFGALPLPPDMIREYIGWGVRHLVAWTHPSLDPLRPDRLPSPEGPPPIAADELDGFVADFRRIYSGVMLHSARIYPGIAKLCHELDRDGVALAVISNKPDRFLRQILAAMALADPFALVIGSDTVPAIKPDPLPLRIAAERLRVPLAQCVMVGDGPLDVRAAHAAGIPCCSVTWGFNTEKSLRALGPTYVAHSAGELGAWLRGFDRE